MDANGKVRVGVVGLGGISSAWLNPLVSFKDVEVVGLCDLDPVRAEQQKEKHGLAMARIVATLDELIDTCAPDVVCDCTVPAAHAAVTRAALAKGCHVFGEKPMADGMDNARTMCESARAAGKLYAVMQNRRCNPQAIRFRDLLGTGAIGRITSLNADFYLGAHFGGFRDEMEHVLLLDMAIHTFDAARFISGCDPVSVYCHEWNPAGSWYHHGASAVALFEMTGGVVFTYRGSWCAEGHNTSWESEWRAVGTDGTALWDGKDTVRAQAPSSGEGFMRPQQDLPVGPAPEPAWVGHGGILRELVDAVKGGRRPQTHCDDNIKSLAMVHAAIESARTGLKVPVRV